MINLAAASCWACFFELPVPEIFLDSGISTIVLNNGLCWGPVFLKNVYLGNTLNLLRLNSWSLVLESIIVTIDLSI